MPKKTKVLKREFMLSPDAIDCLERITAKYGLTENAAVEKLLNGERLPLHEGGVLTAETARADLFAGLSDADGSLQKLSRVYELTSGAVVALQKKREVRLGSSRGDVLEDLILAQRRSTALSQAVPQWIPDECRDGWL